MCPPFASVEDDADTISRKLLAFSCNRCAEEAGLNKNIPQRLKDMLKIG